MGALDGGATGSAAWLAPVVVGAGGGTSSAVVALGTLSRAGPGSTTRPIALLLDAGAAATSSPPIANFATMPTSAATARLPATTNGVLLRRFVGASSAKDGATGARLAVRPRPRAAPG